MRSILLPSLLVVVACSGDDGGAANQAASEAAAAALELRPGAWAVTGETMSVAALDKGKPAMNPKVGALKETETCIAAGQQDKPPAALFSGSTDACDTQRAYLSRGRISAQLSCKRAGLDSPYQISVDGTYTAKSFAAESSLATALIADGDVRIITKLTGRRTGECPAT